MRRFGFATALAVITAIAFASVGDLPIGEPPPDFTLARIDSGEITLSAEQGLPVVIIFGELYQENTRSALADLADIIAREELGESVRVLVIVSENSPPEELEADCRELGITFPVLMDPDRVVFVEYGVISAIPCAVFIDAEGLVHHTDSGYGISFVDTAEMEIAFLAGQISEEELQAQRLAVAPQDPVEAHLHRRVRLGDQLRRRGYNVQAREQYEAVLAEAASHADAHLGLAQIELERSDLMASERHVSTALEQHPHSPRALKTLARIQILRGDLDEAEVTLQDLVHKAGEDVRTLYLMGRLSEARDEPRSALRHYRQVSELLLTEEGW